MRVEGAEAEVAAASVVALGPLVAVSLLSVFSPAVATSAVAVVVFALIVGHRQAGLLVVTAYLRCCRLGRVRRFALYRRRLSPVLVVFCIAALVQLVTRACCFCVASRFFAASGEVLVVYI